MCQLFINADPKLWASTTRSLRIDGMVTSIRLENSFWSVLKEIAERDKLTIPVMITRLYRESLEAGHDLSNFTSFLRVCCNRYMALQLKGIVPKDLSIPLTGYTADEMA